MPYPLDASVSVCCRRYDDDDGEDRTVGDWRSGPRAAAPSPPPRGDRGYGDRDRDGGRRGFDRYEAPRDRGGYDRGDRGRFANITLSLALLVPFVVPSQT